jgi:hypothetical protein
VQHKAPEDREPAYRTLSPFSENLLDGIYNRILKATRLTLSSEEILNTSPEVRDKFRGDVTPKRVPIKTMNKAKAMGVKFFDL